MNAESWDKISEILDEIVSLNASERERFLNTAGLEPEVRAEVLSLLNFENEAGNLMQVSAVEFSDLFKEGDAASDVLAGQKIGPYRVVAEAGHGGMGAVYMAERTKGDFSQRVALKLLKREMNTSFLRRRFQKEREILARLDHPNIARLLDAGTTDDKIPYLVMEYVDGSSIIDYCNEHQLGLEQRLDLFRQVCSTVDFAHRNLIVHRDIKPSNIFVTEEGVPKLLDFGISKILSTGIDRTDLATVTRLGAMTPRYASPEQLRSESVTTATDIYSLGVILYELLSGHRPFESKENNLNEIFQAVIETDPPLPSLMAETGSQTHNEQLDNDGPGERADDKSGLKTSAIRAPDTHPNLPIIKPQYLRGDLDNIILKSINKEPERRYASAERLSDDIKRYLDGLPVTARRDTLAYRCEKFVKRHRFGVAAAGLMLLALIAGIAATLWQASIANAENLRAESRFNDVRKLANSYLFDVYPEIENLEGSLKAREIIINNALEYIDSLSSEALDDIELKRELATAYEKIGDIQGSSNTPSLGNITSAIESYEKAQRLREGALETDPSNIEMKEELAANYHLLAKTLFNNSETARAEEFYERSAKLRREIAQADPEAVEPKNKLAIVLLDHGAIPAFNSQTERAFVLFDEALSIIEGLLIKDPDNTDLKRTLARGLRTDSQARSLISDYAGALERLARSEEITKELIAEFPNEYRLVRTGWINDYRICEVYIQQKDGQNAVTACLKAVPFNEEVLKKEPSDAVAQSGLATSYFNAARAFRLSSQPDGAIEYAGKAIAVMSKLFQGSPANIDYKRNIAIYETEMSMAFLKTGRAREALSHLQKTQADLQEIVEADKESTIYRYDLAIAYRLAGEAHFKLGDRLRAAAEVERAIELIKELKEIKALKETDQNLVEELEKEKAKYSA